MDKQQILSRISSILSEELGIEIEKIKKDSLIADDLGADSLDTAEIALKIGEEYKIDIDVNQLDQIKSVNDVVELVFQKSGKNICSEK